MWPRRRRVACRRSGSSPPPLRSGGGRRGKRGHVRVGRRRVRARPAGGPEPQGRGDGRPDDEAQAPAGTWSWNRLWATCRIRSRGADRSKASSKLPRSACSAPACWAVTTQSKSTPSRRLDAAKRSSSQFVMTPRRKRCGAGRGPRPSRGRPASRPPTRRTSSSSASVGSKPSSRRRRAAASASTSRYRRYGPASAADSWRA